MCVAHVSCVRTPADASVWGEGRVPWAASSATSPAGNTALSSQALFASLLGAFVNSGLSITKAPKRRKLNHEGGGLPTPRWLPKVINVMRADDGGPCCAWATPSALRMSPPPAPPPHASAHRIAWRPWQLHNRPLSRWRLFPKPALFPGSSLSSGTHGRGPGRAGCLPPLGCAWPSAWCEGDPKGLTVSRCEDAHVRVMCAHA